MMKITCLARSSRIPRFGQQTKFPAVRSPRKCKLLRQHQLLLQYDKLNPENILQTEICNVNGNYYFHNLLIVLQPYEPYAYSTSNPNTYSPRSFLILQHHNLKFEMFIQIKTKVLSTIFVTLVCSEQVKNNTI